MQQKTKAIEAHRLLGLLFLAMAPLFVGACAEPPPPAAPPPAVTPVLTGARRAARIGRWSVGKWRPAIENYVPSVQLDNTAPLNAAAQPFATYKVTMHNRIHPIFAEEFLAFLDGLPKDHPLNQHLVDEPRDRARQGHGARSCDMGVTKASGMTAFDIAALNAVDRAQPFGKAPDIIASPDGNVYFHWEFHRDPVDACTTRNAFPFLLKDPPKRPTMPRGPAPSPVETTPDGRSGAP